jgi:UDP-N-acetylglucosamine--N-acetylmuramyl-(pentapeptide) pyrophosphoryl-undecaprenol N-acetylglucosamine transferase
MDEARKTIVMCGGGTLGPVTPLLAVAAEIRRANPNARIEWVGTQAGPEKRLVEAAGLPFYSADIFRIIFGFFQSYLLLGRVQAGVVVSAGGFVAVPVVWAAALRRIPVHLHQQDPIPGLANKLCLPFAASMSVALEASVKDFRLRGGVVPVWTGNPVRAEIAAGSRTEADTIFGLESDVPVVLVLGGGTGAAGINDRVRGALPRLLAEVQLIHVAGIGKASGAHASRYHEREILTNEMPHALAAADLVVTRAGMGTLTELAALGKACLVVPMPDSHQETNAALFANSGAAMLLNERETDADAFAAAILELIKDAPRRAELGAAMARMSRPDAAARMAARIVALLD